MLERVKTPARKSSLARDVILSEIIRGKYARNDRIPTEMDLASRLGMSRHTVREAVGSLVHEGVLERRQGSGTYVRRIGPQTGMNRLTRMDAVRVGLAGNGDSLTITPLGRALLKGISSQVPDLPPLEIRLLMTDPLSKGVGRVHVREAVEADMVDALVCGDIELPPVDLDPALERGLPTICFGFEYPHRKLPCVRSDLIGGVANVVGFLCQTGRDRIGLLLGRRQGRTAAAFLAGTTAAYGRLGKELDPGSVAYTEWNSSLVPDAAGKLMAVGVNAIICCTDEYAVSVIGYLAGRGVRVPEDVAVVGTNDTAATDGTRHPPLTTLRLPLEDMGCAIRDLIYEGIRTGQVPARTLLFQPELVVRQSTPKGRGNKNEQVFAIFERRLDYASI